MTLNKVLMAVSSLHCAQETSGAFPGGLNLPFICLNLGQNLAQCLASSISIQ